ANVILYLLMALSVLSIGVIIERWWFFTRRRTDIGALSDGLRKALRTHDLTAARKLLEKDPSIEAEVIAEALGWYDQGPDDVEENANGLGNVLLASLQSRNGAVRLASEEPTSEEMALLQPAVEA